MTVEKYNPISHKRFEEQVFQDAEFIKEHEALDEKYTQIHEMLLARKKAHKTQADVAKEMKTSQTAVARIEKSFCSKTNYSPTLNTLKKYAHALGCRLLIKFVPIDRSSR